MSNTQKIGRYDAFGVGRETTYGDGATPNIFPIVEDVSFSPNIERVENMGAIGRLEHRHDALVSKESSAVDASGQVTGNSIGMFLLAALGDVATSADTPEAGVYTHDFTVRNDNAHPSFQLEFGDGNLGGIIHGVKGARLDKLGISLSAGEKAEFSASFIGKKSDDSITPTTASVTEEAPFAARHFSLSLADNVAGLSSSPQALAKVTSLSLDIEKNLEQIYGIGEISPADLVNKTMKISGSMELILEDETLLGYVRNDTRKAAKILAVQNGVTIGSATNPSLEIVLARVAFDSWEPTGSMDDVRQQSVAFTAEYSIAELMSISAKLVNTQASY